MMYILVLTLLVGLLQPYFRYLNFVSAFFTLSFGGYLNGFITGSMMRYFGASEWKIAASSAAFVLPTCIVVVFVLVDVIEYFEKAEQVFPFTSVVFFTLLWAFLTVPLTYFGAYNGFMRVRAPKQTSPVRRNIPAQPFWLRDPFQILVGSFIIFSTIVVEF